MRSRSDRFTEFFLVEGPRIERFATMLVRDPVQGAELAQEALSRIYARWGRLERDAPAAYAKRIVINLVRSAHRADTMRRLKPIPTWASEAGHPAHGTTDRIDDSLAVLDALGALSPVRRATVLLRFYEDMSEQQIAALLDRPVGTVKSDIHRALRQLRPLLETADVGRRAR